jgi:hypothetical protein
MVEKSKESESRFVWRIVDDEALIVDLESGGFFSLDRVGTEVWKGLKDGLDLARIVGAIAEKYGVDQQRVQRDVSELLEELNREGLMD